MSQCMNLHVLAGLAAAFAASTSAMADVRPTGSDDEIRAVVAEMLADAEGRSSMLQSGSSGHDGKNFFISSSDGQFTLKVKGQIQFRYIMNFGEDEDDPGSTRPDDFESGFQARRTKVYFEGTAFENFDYSVNGAFDRDGGDFTLEDAWVRYNFDGGWSLRWGQFKLPFMREELVSGSKQLAADRSLTNEIFNQDRSQGIELRYQAEQFGINLAFSDGFRSANTEFDDTPVVVLTDLDGDGVSDVNSGGGFGFSNQSGTESDFAFTARAEWLANGTWDQFSDFTSMPGSDFGLLIGGAAHWETVDEGDVIDSTGVVSAEGDSDYLAWTLDISLEGDGWNAFAAYNGSNADIEVSDIAGVGEDIDGDTDPTDHGFVVQGGFFFPDTDWELFARYDLTLFDDDERPIGEDDDDSFSSLTAGVNYYMHGHAAKFTGDVVYFIDDSIPSGFDDRNDGIGRVGGGDNDEFAVRLQFQLLF